MYNKVILIGNLTKDVELKYFQNGNGCVANLNLAINRKYKKQDGTQGEEACFIDVKIFGRTAEVANQYLKKGSKILVEGRLAQEHWEQNGQKRSKHIIQGDSIQMLDNKPQSQAQHPQAQQYKEAYQTGQDYDMTPQERAMAEEYYKNTKTPQAGEIDQDSDIPF